MSAGEMSDGPGSLFPLDSQLPVARRRGSVASVNSVGSGASNGAAALMAGSATGVASLASQRGQYRYSPMATRSSVRERKRRITKDSFPSDDEDDDFPPAPSNLPANSEA